MAHAVYQRGSVRAQVPHDGGYWLAVDPRTPGWQITADTAHEALAFWRECWLDVQRSGW